MTDGAKLFEDMNTRSREVFRRVVEGYLENGEPMGSRTLTRTLTEKVSAATVRNVMQDLEYLGLLDSPHISARLYLWLDAGLDARLDSRK